MSQDQTKATDEGPFAVFRVGRVVQPVFCKSRETAIKIAAAESARLGGRYLVVQIVGAMAATPRWEQEGCLVGAEMDGGKIERPLEGLDNSPWPTAI